MKKILLVLLFSSVCSIISAQNDIVTQDTYDKLYDEVEKLKVELAKVEQQQKHILDSLNKVIASKRNDLEINRRVKSLEEVNSKLEQNLSVKKKELQGIIKQHDDNISMNDALVDGVEDRNALLVKAFQGAIYYPIRTRYSERLISDALAYGPVFSKDAGLKGSFDQYKGMLVNYKRYNENLIECFTDCIEIAKEFKKGRYNGKSVKDYAEQKASDRIVTLIKATAYYKEVYVKVMSNPNAISIPYLNSIMKDLLGRKKNVDERVHELFIKRLEPKDK